VAALVKCRGCFQGGTRGRKTHQSDNNQARLTGKGSSAREACAVLHVHVQTNSSDHPELHPAIAKM
jgi:hypothetical protein